jgi:GntR family transcriptional regulator
MRQRGLPTTTKVVLIQVVLDKEVAQKMGIRPEEELVKLQRLRFVEREPIALQTAFVRHRFCPGLVDRTLHSGSLYETLENGYGLHIGHAQQVFEAKPADEYEARMLDISVGYPVLMLERFTYLHNKEPIEYVRSVYRGDKYRFVVSLQR